MSTAFSGEDPFRRVLKTHEAISALMPVAVRQAVKRLDSEATLLALHRIHAARAAARAHDVDAHYRAATEMYRVFLAHCDQLGLVEQIRNLSAALGPAQDEFRAPWLLDWEHLISCYTRLTLAVRSRDSTAAAYLTQQLHHLPELHLPTHPH